MPKKSYADVLPGKPAERPVSSDERLGRNKQKMTEADRRSLQNQIAETEADIEEAKELKSSPDTSNLRRQVQHKKDALAHDEDLQARGNEKDRIHRRIKEIESVIRPKMPTKTEMWAKDPTAHAQAVRKNLWFQENYDYLVHEWQNLQLKLDPENPYAQSLENIRPD